MMELEQVARLHAALQAGTPWDELLRRERVTRAQWLAAERAWLGALAEETAAGRWELCDRYLRAISGAPAIAAAAPVVVNEVSEPRRIERPTYEISAEAEPLASAIPAAMARIADLEGTQMASSPAPVGDALPFAHGAAPSLPPSASPGWMPKSMRGLAEVGETQAATAAPVSKPLPFQATDTPSPQRAPGSTSTPRIPAAMRNIADVESTHIASGSAPTGPALPFAPGAAPASMTSAPTSSTAGSAPTGWMPKSMRGFADVDGTQLATAPPSGPALPFNAERRLPPEPVATSAPAPTAPQTSAPAPTAPQTSAPAPTAPQTSAPAPRAHAATLMATALSLEQYASLCVEIDLEPGKRAEILYRYRVTEAQHSQLDALFRARMGADPALRASFDAACNAYRTWLVHSRGGR